MAKLHIDVSKGIFEVEGDPELIREMFTQFKADLINIHHTVKSQPQALIVNTNDGYATDVPEISTSSKSTLEAATTKKRKKGSPLAMEVDKELLAKLQTGNPENNVLPFDKYVSEKFDPKTISSNQDFVTVCLYYLFEKLEIKTPVGLNQIYTCFRAIRREAGNLKKAIYNNTQRTSHIDGGDHNNLKLYPAGISQVEKIEI